MRQRILICVLVVLAIASTIWNWPRPSINPAPRRVIMPVFVHEQPAEKPIPPNWSRHKFNGREYYLIPLAAD